MSHKACYLQMRFCSTGGQLQAEFSLPNVEFRPLSGESGIDNISAKHFVGHIRNDSLHSCEPDVLYLRRKGASGLKPVIDSLAHKDGRRCWGNHDALLHRGEEMKVWCDHHSSRLVVGELLNEVMWPFVMVERGRSILEVVVTDSELAGVSPSPSRKVARMWSGSRGPRSDSIRSYRPGHPETFVIRDTASLDQRCVKVRNVVLLGDSSEFPEFSPHYLVHLLTAPIEISIGSLHELQLGHFFQRARRKSLVPFYPRMNNC